MDFVSQGATKVTQHSCQISYTKLHGRVYWTIAPFHTCLDIQPYFSDGLVKKLSYLVLLVDVNSLGHEILNYFFVALPGGPIDGAVSAIVHQALKVRLS